VGVGYEAAWVMFLGQRRSRRRKNLPQDHRSPTRPEVFGDQWAGWKRACHNQVDKTRTLSCFTPAPPRWPLRRKRRQCGLHVKRDPRVPSCSNSEYYTLPKAHHTAKYESIYIYIYTPSPFERSSVVERIPCPPSSPPSAFLGACRPLPPELEIRSPFSASWMRLRRFPHLYTASATIAAVLHLSGLRTFIRRSYFWTLAFALNQLHTLMYATSPSPCPL